MIRKLVLLAFFVHSIAVISALSRDDSAILATDSYHYLTVAENLVEHGAFSRESQPPYLWEPYRLPLLPVLMAVSLTFTGEVWPVILLTPLFAAGAAYATIKLAEAIHPRSGLVAGLIFTFYPVALHWDRFLLTDSIGAYSVVIAVYATVAALRSKHGVWWMGVSITSWWSLQLMRPPLALMGLFVLLVGVAICRERTQWIRAVIIGLLTLPVPFLLSYMNYQAHGVFNPSLNSTTTFREYLAVRVETSDNGDIFLERRTWVAESNAALAATQTGSTFYGRKNALESEQIADIIDTYGLLAVIDELVKEMIRQLAAIPPYDNAVMFLIVALYWYTFLILSMVGLLNRQLLVIALWLMFAYFLTSGATSGWVGTRLRLPGDLLLIPVVSAVLTRLRGQWQRSIRA